MIQTLIEIIKYGVVLGFAVALGIAALMVLLILAVCVTAISIRKYSDWQYKKDKQEEAKDKEKTKINRVIS